MRVRGSRWATFAAVLCAACAGAGWQWSFSGSDRRVVGWDHLWVACTIAGTVGAVMFFCWAMRNDNDEILASEEQAAQKRLDEIRQRRERLKASQ